MKLYRCDLLLHDYLFFATTERGKVAETGPFIHNYALTYALGWAVSDWRNEVQQPHYREQLGAVGRRYITPAKLLHGSYLLNQYNTMSESYSLGKGRSIGYPDWGFIKCFRPGALFRCYVISDDVQQLPTYIRLGKFMAKTALRVTPAIEPQEQGAEQPKDEQRSKARLSLNQPLLNWDDLAPSTRPVVYDIIAGALPTRLVDNPVFDNVQGRYLVGRFTAGRDEEPVRLPLAMGYLGENLCASW